MMGRKLFGQSTESMTFVLHRWDVYEYRRAIAAGIFADQAVELLDGFILDMTPEGPFHAYSDRTIADYLRQTLVGQAYISEAHPVTLSVTSEPEPDIAIVRLPSSRYRNQHPAAEDIFWLIEIADSSLDKDLNQKAEAYAQAGVPEYWVIDLKNQSVQVMLNPQSQRYQSATEHRIGSLSPQAFPTLQVAVSLLLGEV